MTRRWFVSLLLVVLTLELPVGGSAAPNASHPKLPSYKVIDLGEFWQPRINNSSEIAGVIPHDLGPLQWPELRLSVYRHGKITDLHALLPAYVQSRNQLSSRAEVLDLNDAGDMLVLAGLRNVRGDYETPPYVFLYASGQMQRFSERVRRSDLQPLGLNNAGDIVGTVTTASGHLNAFLLTATGDLRFWANDSRYTDTIATRISNSGMIAGRVSFIVPPYDLYVRGVIFSPDGILEIGTPPGANLSDAYDINDAGEIAANAALNNWVINPRGFLWQNGQMTTLLLSGDTASQVSGINNHSQVVGTSRVYPVFDLEDYRSRGFIFSDGHLHDLNDLIDRETGWSIDSAYDINDRGEVLAAAFLNGAWRTILLKPKSRH